MKNKILLLVTFFFIQFVWGQEKIIVDYESKLEFDLKSMEDNIQIPGSSEAQKKEFMKSIVESMTKPNYYKLSLTPNESTFEFVDKLNNEQPQDGLQIRVVMTSSGMGVIYKNLAENLSINSMDAFNKSFLIKDTLKNYQWKISKESKEILGYEVRKAEVELEDLKKVIAWYAPKLAYKNGPEYFQGLPGLILELIILEDPEGEKRKMTYTATSLSVDTSNKPVQRPSKGKIISNEEFQKISQEQMQKMTEMFQSGVERD